MGYLVESFNNVFVVFLASFNHSKYLATVGEREKGKAGKENVGYLVESLRGGRKGKENREMTVTLWSLLAMVSLGFWIPLSISKF